MLAVAGSSTASVWAGESTALPEPSCSKLLLAYEGEQSVYETTDEVGPATIEWIPGGGLSPLGKGLPSPIWFTNELDRDGIPRYQPSTPGIEVLKDIDLSGLHIELQEPTLSIRSFAGQISSHEYLFSVVIPPLNNGFQQRVQLTELRQAVAVWNSEAKTARLLTSLDQKWEALFFVGSPSVKVLVRTTGRFGLLTLADGSIESVTQGYIAKFSSGSDEGVIVTRGLYDKAAIFVLSERGLAKVAVVASVGSVTVKQRSQRSDVALDPRGDHFAFVTEVPPLRDGPRKRMAVRIYSTKTGKLVGKVFYFSVVQERKASLTIPKIAWFKGGVAVMDDGYLAYVRSGRLVHYSQSSQTAPEYVSCR